MTIGASWTPLLAFLWLAYLSFCSVGQAFLSFQWDVLLLETGEIHHEVAFFCLYNLIRLHCNFAGQLDEAICGWTTGAIVLV